MLTFLISTVLLIGDSVAESPKAGDCTAIVHNFAGNRGEPKVLGEPFQIPTLEMTVYNRKSGVAEADRSVIVRYCWEWLEYPYPEHPFGAWADAYDLVDCRTDGSGKLVVPRYKLVPKGWYSGILLLGKKPSFKNIEISVENFHYWLSPKEIRALAKQKHKEVEASREDGFEGDYRVVISAR